MSEDLQMYNQSYCSKHRTFHGPNGCPECGLVRDVGKMVDEYKEGLKKRVELLSGVNPEEAKVFKYQVQHITASDAQSLETQLNARGIQGLELVQVIPVDQLDGVKKSIYDIIAIFKVHHSS